MNLRDLHYFVMLAEIKHFGEAAKRCYVSQPTLSMQIKKLEDELGVVLFERTNKQVFLTDSGHALLPSVKKILMQVGELKSKAHSLQHPLAGHFKLGVIPTVAPYLLPLVIAEITQQLPLLRIGLMEEQTNRLIQLLEEGAIDAAIMAFPVEGAFTSAPFLVEDFYFTCPKSHPMADLTSVSIDDLPVHEMMLLAEGHCLRDQAIAVCQMADRARADLTGETSGQSMLSSLADFTATSLETLRLMVQAGIGVTLLPALAITSTTSSSLRYIPFKEPKPSRTLALFWRASSPRVECLFALQALLREQFNYED